MCYVLRETLFWFTLWCYKRRVTQLKTEHYFAHFHVLNGLYIHVVCVCVLNLYVSVTVSAPPSTLTLLQINAQI